MYTPEERETFAFCLTRWLGDNTCRLVLRALVLSMEDAPTMCGASASDIAGRTARRPPRWFPSTVGRLLGELARDTWEHGVPIAVTVDADGTLRYRLSSEQLELVRLALARTAPPMYVLGL